MRIGGSIRPMPVCPIRTFFSPKNRARSCMSAVSEDKGEHGPDYWRGTRRPLTCLVFLAPLLATYEAGVHWLGGRNADTMRNGADFWIRNSLERLGLNSPWLVPSMIVIGLLVWHIARQETW